MPCIPEFANFTCLSDNPSISSQGERRYSMAQTTAFMSFITWHDLTSALLSILATDSGCQAVPFGTVRELAEKVPGLFAPHRGDGRNHRAHGREA